MTADNTTPRLLPCPFCGSEKIDWIYIEETGEGYHLCSGCSAKGPACYHAPDGLIDGYWNKRRATGLVNWLEVEMMKIDVKAYRTSGDNSRHNELQIFRKMVRSILEQ